MGASKEGEIYLPSAAPASADSVDCADYTRKNDGPAG